MRPGWHETTPDGWWPTRVFKARARDRDGFLHYVAVKTTEFWDGTDEQIIQSMIGVEADLERGGWVMLRALPWIKPTYPHSWIEADCPRASATAGHVG